MFELEITTTLSPRDAHVAVEELQLPGFKGILSKDKTCAIFESELDSAQKTQVIDAVAAYELAGRSVVDQRPKVLRYTDNPDFQSVDYIRGLTIRLQPQLIFNIRGELTQVNYFAEETLDGNGFPSYQDLIVREDYTYVRLPQPPNFALSRTVLITWFNEDGTANVNTKPRIKHYSTTGERIAEAARRRQNILTKIQEDSLIFLVVAGGLSQIEAVGAGFQFFGVYAAQVGLYRDIGTAAPLLSAVTSDNQITWLNIAIGPDRTIRDHIIEILTS